MPAADAQGAVRVGRTTAHEVLELRVDQLIHMLLAASSGFGKTTALLRILEELLRLDVQVVILDVEGDFLELRAAADFVLVGPEGDTPVDVASARTLARLVREHRFNLIVDLSDEPPRAQREWVAEFAEGLSHLPRNLWGPMVVVVDEADTLAPQKQKKGQPIVSQEALVNLASRGRKRGIKVLFATQRLAKLDMDVRGECADKLIGHFNASADRRGAVDELAATGEGGIRDEIARLKPGHFYAFGRALHVDDAVLVQVELPKTEPPAKGTAARPPPPPRAKVQKLIADVLQDLPARAAQEAATLEEARREITRLEQHVKQLAKGRGASPARPEGADELREARQQLKTVQRELRAANEAQERAVAAAHREAQQQLRDLQRAHDAERAAVEQRAAAELARTREAIQVLTRTQGALLTESSHLLETIKRLDADSSVKRAEAKLERTRERTTELRASAAADPPPPSRRDPAPRPVARGAARPADAETHQDDQDDQDEDEREKGTPGATGRRILNVLAELEDLGHDVVDRPMLAAYAGTRSARSSTFRNAISELNSAGLVTVERGGPVRLTDEGRRAAAPRASPTSSRDLLARLDLAYSQRRILDVLLASYPQKVDRADLAARSGHESPKSSTFRNNVSQLTVRGLVRAERGGPIAAAAWFHELLEQLGGMP